MAYVYGNQDVCETTEMEAKVDPDKMRNSLYQVIAGKTWEERIKEYSTYEELKALVDTETHRIFGDGQYDTAKDLSSIGEITKTWGTMKDDKVRESHWYLEGLEVGLDEYFYTLSGERTLYPGQFGVPEEDCNCRCFIIYRMRRRY